MAQGRFLRLAGLLIANLGSPVPGEPGSIVDSLRWNLPRLVVIASFSEHVVHMNLVNPKWQQDQDDWDEHLRDSDDGEG